MFALSLREDTNHEPLEHHEGEAEEEVDIESAPLDEVAETVAGFPVVVEIHIIFMYHGGAKDDARRKDYETHHEERCLGGGHG